MNFTELPTEIQVSIIKQLYPSDLLNIVQHIPEWKHLITSDIFRIVTNDLSELKLKYGLSDDFYLDYKCNLDRNVDRDTYRKLRNEYYEKETNNTVLDPSLLKGFKGALLIEIYQHKASLTKFDDHLLEHDPIEIFWHTSTKCNKFEFLHGFVQASQRTRLKKLKILIGADDELNNKSHEQYEILSLPLGISSNKLHIPFVKSLHFSFQELSGYSLTDMKTVIPDLESVNIAFEDIYDDYINKKFHGSTSTLGLVEDWNEPWVDPSWSGPSLGYDKSGLDEFFETNVGGSFDFLKYFQLKYFHNSRFNLFKNLQLSNLEKLLIDSASINSIKDLDLPNLKTLDIKNSAIYEISNLSLNSLQKFSIELKYAHLISLRDRFDHIRPTIQNMKSSSLKTFSLTSSFKIKKISDLEFPSLQTITIRSYNVSNKAFERLINLASPQLENIIIEKFLLDKLYPLFQNSPNLKNISISSCPDFNIEKMGSLSALESLILTGMQSIQDFNKISLPALQNMEIRTIPETRLSMENCSFKNLKTLAIYRNSALYYIQDSTLTFLNNDIPQLKKVSISGQQITNHFSTEPYPDLEELTIAKLKSIEILPSNRLKMLDLSKNPTIIEINKSDQLPNLKEYKKPGTINRKVGKKRRKK
ncbi:Internalin-I [Wickerhamomyces ciferrii]|uniref:Internalin-I n=1 Tax=Wickerhamomyces ciferrii (strain ATCC 14091 / BCRC 22168 / CBS 111 / JCM 3599 / NBRC 0793 / NRRL Y-1031 F-60-10) TaxID=1206466 RepID=K0KE15_WICCF|nr:Internalin-I [Wickerhamomyces ciferrii]CCH41166.1 Internalin-I [Wickerhamomyces ciferrii]